MRCDQYVGLNPWARETVQATQKVREVGVRHFPDGTSESFDREAEVPVARIEVVGQIDGTFDEVVANLHRYTLPSGEVFEEFVQDSPWSSGPCYFIALKRADGSKARKSLWRQKEIELYT